MEGAGGMTQSVKASLAKPDIMSSMLEIQMVEGEK